VIGTPFSDTFGEAPRAFSGTRRCASSELTCRRPYRVKVADAGAETSATPSRWIKIRGLRF